MTQNDGAAETSTTDEAIEGVPAAVLVAPSYWVRRRLTANA
jgi:hypothetical protein